MNRKRILEAAFTADQAKAQNLALKIDNSFLVLYDPSKMLSGLESSEYDADFLSNAVLGFLEAKSPAGKNRCHGAMMIRSVAAVKGYGPLMYDIAMSMYGKITSDRVQTSDAAEKIWNYYKDNRPDVLKEPFDDVTAPETSNPEDDCTLQYGRNSLNYAYSGSSVDYRSLLNNHNEFLKNAGKFLSSKALEELVMAAGDAFFRRMY